MSFTTGIALSVDSYELPTAKQLALCCISMCGTRFYSKRVLYIGSFGFRDIVCVLFRLKYQCCRTLVSSDRPTCPDKLVFHLHRSKNIILILPL